MTVGDSILRLARFAPFAILIAFLSACSNGPGDEFGVHDPYEERNREVHQGNLDLDRALVRPSSNAYGGVVPEPVRKGVSNFASNLGMPGIMLNNILQARVENAGHNFFRFAINTTLGLGGVFDPATAIGLPERSTDFGETLHVWGFKEGAYLVLPVLGPSTERDAIGKVVDFAINPTRMVIKAPESHYVTVLSATARFGDRYEYSDLVDELLYDSADSYAQARLIYLQNRRHELGEVQTEEIDPYALDTEGF